MTTACAAGGIDAGKSYLDVGLAPSRRHFRVANGRDGIEHIVDRLHEAGIDKVVLEAIGPYAQPVVTRLVAAGFAVGLVNPRRIKAFREAEGRSAKTDRLDAALIARFAVKMTDALRPVPSVDQQLLKALATRRRQLVEMIAMEKTRLKQAAEALTVREPSLGDRNTDGRTPAHRSRSRSSSRWPTPNSCGSGPSCSRFPALG